MQKAREPGTRPSSRDGAVFGLAAWWDGGSGRVPRTGDGGTTSRSDAAVLTRGDNGSMDSAARPRAPLALGALLGLLAVAELAARLSASSTVRAGLAAPVGHAGVTVPTALLMCGFCLLATVPAGLLRPVPAAVTVYLAAALSLALFELVTIAGAAALLVAAYRLARAGSLALAVALGAPFLGLAVVLASTGSGRTMAVAGGTSGLAATATETRVLAVLLASAIPLATVAAMARGAREQSQSHSAAREVTEGMLADHLARGERARIARELHDVVAHHISMIAVQAETGRLTTPGLPAAGAQRFAAIGDTARAGLTEMRRLLGVLREDAEQDTAAEPVLQPGRRARSGVLSRACRSWAAWWTTRGRHRVVWSGSSCPVRRTGWIRAWSWPPTASCRRPSPTRGGTRPARPSTSSCATPTTPCGCGSATTGQARRPVIAPVTACSACASGPPRSAGPCRRATRAAAVSVSKPNCPPRSRTS